MRLPRPPGIFRRWLAAHPRAVDVTIVVCYLFGCLLMGFIDAASAGWSDGAGGPSDPLDQNSEYGGPGWPHYLAWPWWPLAILRAAVVAVALLYRRRFPLAGLIVVSLALFGDQGAQTVANSTALCFLLYAVPVYRSVAAGWVGYGIAVVTGTLQSLMAGVEGLVPATGSPAGNIVRSNALFGTVGEFALASIMSAIWLLAILMVGINFGNRRRYVDAIIDRAHQLARERDQLAQLAVAEERSRIAREMHDIVAHSVSVMIALSEGAARTAEIAPGAANEAMRRSAETGRTALAEMRRLLGALSEPAEGSAELVPQPGVGELPALVQGFRDAGLKVDLVITGDTMGDRGQELAVYRVVQEGLTNTLRYAGSGAPAAVTVDLLADRTVVTVRDHGRVTAGPGPAEGMGSGRGLQGLAERVRVFGGSIASGPLASGGWQLVATLPVSADARDVGVSRHPNAGSE